MRSVASELSGHFRHCIVLPPFCSRVYVCVRSVGVKWRENRTESGRTAKSLQKWTGNVLSAMLTISHMTHIEVAQSTDYVSASFYGTEEESYACVNGFP